MENITNQKTRSKSTEKLNDTDDDGGVSSVKCASSRFENINSVKNHGVDPGELLEEHKSHRYA